MNFSRLFNSLVRPSLVASALVLAPVVASPALAQQTPPAVQAPGARGAARGPASGAVRGRGQGPEAGAMPGRAGHHGGRGRHDGATPEQRFERRVQHMVGSLGLDEAQAAQVRQIMTEGRAQHEALASERLTGEQMQARHRAIMEANGQRIRALLRPDQQRVFDFHAQRMREAGDRFQERGGPGHGRGERLGGRMLDHMTATLGLDAAQQAAVRQIFEQGRAQHEALRGQSLTGEERRARHQAIMEANGQRIRALLRPDQQQLFDQQVSRLRERLQGRFGGPRAGGATAPSATPPSGI